MSDTILDPARKEHRTYIEKIDALLVHVFRISEEESLNMCTPLFDLSEDKQREVLHYIMEVIEKIHLKKHQSIQNINYIQHKLIKLDETLDLEEAEKMVNSEIPNL